MRPSTPQMRAALKLATKAAIARAGDAAAIVREGLVRIGETALSFAGSPKAEHADRFVSLDTALDLDFVAGEPHHARALAHPQGYELVPMRRPKGIGPIQHRDIRDFKQETHELFDVMFVALEDGTACRADAVAILREIDGVEEQCRLLRAKCEGLL
ncbi:hypothetical protein [Aureimonas sp. D3]|uniref:hypothetical protein n=1 Tax=Aureimonas sp. D3 TaxID=1638164 RepID=UPI000AC29220|nr:hypothetical protein [Aureimonas sp. D3]